MSFRRKIFNSMGEKVHFCLKIAEILFKVHCSFDSTKEFCGDYLTDEIGDYHTIGITLEDIERERPKLGGKNGDAECLSHAFLEPLVLCRKIACILPQFDRVLFHGSSLAIDGNGVLFTAKSGTGKSTHTRFWRETFGDRVVMVNDDKPFLHIAGDHVSVYGTPWRGKHRLGENICAPVKAICFVCRGEENRIEPVSSRELFPLLLQQTFSPEDPTAMVKTLALVDRLSRQVPLYRLYCNLDPEAARTAYDGIMI